MKFHQNGPSIPDILLERRDQGQVVFLCGAGVSREAEMPDFVTLTKDVIRQLGADDDPSVIELIDMDEGKKSEEKGKTDPSTIPFDKIYQHLHDEFGREYVNKRVRLRLKESCPAGATLPHCHIVKISSDRNGNPQIVTANFDRLFEDCLDNLEIHIPPHLPNVSDEEPLRGVAHMHGRLQEPNDIEKHADILPHDYILSEDDFARVYRGKGGVDQFMESLLNVYTVVVIGYQAKDPLFAYLMRGIRQSERKSGTEIYAFDEDPNDKTKKDWEAFGATLIP